MLGCVQEVLAPSISRAAIRLLRRHGVDVVVVKDETCCGALVHHLGKDEEARDYARRNIDAWTAVIREKPLDAIVVTTSGCGTMVKDYGNLLARDRGYAERAAYVVGARPRHHRVHRRDRTDAADDVDGAPHRLSRRLLAPARPEARCAAALAARPGRLTTSSQIPEGHLCCGSAGTYNLLEPELSGQLRERKLANIAKVKPDVIVTANIGCMMQLQRRHRGPLRPHRRDARLGHGRPGARGARQAQGRGPSDRGPGRARQARPPSWIRPELA